MMPRLAAFVLVLSATALTGCTSQQEAYCEALAEEQEQLSRLAEDATEGGEDVLTPTLESFDRLRAESPDELRDEWDTVVAAYEALADAVQGAGIDPADYDPEDPPPGLAEAERMRLEGVASKLASFRVTEATLGIERHAAEVCDVEFGG